MEESSVDLIEEFQTEDIIAPANRSYNHAKLTYRLSKSFGRYDEKFDILPELEFELSHGRAKPDVAVCHLGKRFPILPTKHWTSTFLPELRSFGWLFLILGKLPS